MAVKQTGRKIYKTMTGKTVDMDLLRQRNELVPAVGNAKVNARGDELGPGGQIIRKREEVMRDFYDDNIEPTQFEASEKVQSLAELVQDTAEVEAPAPRATRARTGQTKAEAKATDDEWVEDEDGNFVKKGD
jgi:hypothetical protein|tara:strand:+ start:71 stop:466 length:396 start_codon:yes stop_codon:yes gene_type:complete